MCINSCIINGFASGFFINRFGLVYDFFSQEKLIELRDTNEGTLLLKCYSHSGFQQSSTYRITQWSIRLCRICNIYLFVIATRFTTITLAGQKQSPCKCIDSMNLTSYIHCIGYHYIMILLFIWRHWKLDKWKKHYTKELLR